MPRPPLGLILSRRDSRLRTENQGHLSSTRPALLRNPPLLRGILSFRRPVEPRGRLAGLARGLRLVARVLKTGEEG